MRGVVPVLRIVLGCRLRGSLPVVVAATIAGAPIPTLSSSVSTTGMNNVICAAGVGGANARGQTVWQFPVPASVQLRRCTIG